MTTDFMRRVFLLRDALTARIPGSLWRYASEYGSDGIAVLENTAPAATESILLRYEQPLEQVVVTARYTEAERASATHAIRESMSAAVRLDLYDPAETHAERIDRDLLPGQRAIRTGQPPQDQAPRYPDPATAHLRTQGDHARILGAWGYRAGRALHYDHESALLMAIGEIERETTVSGRFARTHALHGAVAWIDTQIEALTTLRRQCEEELRANREANQADLKVRDGRAE